ncbi:PaaX family transcriptional regulator C-terminal domain-containing protein [Alcanivoracaceae bacterium MT1]|jgi:phenylacetic acid degradation operon negative regulatory protein
MSNIGKISYIEGMEPTASDLVLDLLSTHDARELSIAALCRAGEACGLRPQNVRVAVNRLLRHGKITSPARGIYALNPQGNSLIEDVRNWLRKEQQAVAWDGGWIGVIDAAVPRREKVAWRRHERALALRGFRALANSGLWLRPDNLIGGVATVREDLKRLGMAPAARVFGVSALSGQDEALIRAQWDTRAMTSAYETIGQRLRTSEATLDTLPLAQAARDSLLLGRAAIRLIIHDPLLPEALMGGDARHRLIDQVRAYQVRAKALWARFLEDG